MTSGRDVAVDIDQMMGWIEEICAQGIRRPGYPADRWVEQWAADRFREFGFEDVRLEPVPVPGWQVDSHSLEVWPAGDGVRGAAAELLPSFPLPFSASAPDGVTAPVVPFDGTNDARGAVALVDLAFSQLPQTIARDLATAVHDPAGEFDTLVQTLPFGPALQAVMEPAIEAGAVGFIGALSGVPWDTHDYYVPYDAVRRPIPGAWISRSTSTRLRSLLDAGPVEARLTIDATSEPLPTHNVVATLASDGEEWVIIGSHHDGPWASAVEDGTGIAMVLAQAKYWAGVAPDDRPHNMCFLLTSGHMAHAAGTQAFIAEHDDLVQQTVLQIHLEHAARECRPDADGNVLVPTDDPEVRWWFTSRIEPLETSVLDALRVEALGRSLVFPPDVFGPMPTTDGAFFHPAGVPLVHFLTAPMYLFDSCDTIDKVHEASFGPVTRAVIRILEDTKQWTAKSMRAAVRSG